MTTYEEAYAQSLEYFNGDTIATSTYLSKYALTSPEGDIEEPTPEYMHKRLAKELARIESKYDDSLSEEQIFDYLDRFKYIIPQGSPMAGVGNPYQITSLSNCFVIEAPYDSYGGILKTDQEQAQLMKRRGGVGFDISTIRPQGIVTSNAAKTTDGIGIFMERFSNTCREVAQGGRRGALMITISVHHPEIRTFINIKRDLEKVTGANISIRLSDEFMEAVKTETDVELRWPVDSDSPTIRTQESAKEIWDDIIEGAHISAEPGLLFWDNVTKWSPADAYKSLGFGTVSTNPCFAGDTLVATADGRNAVSIQQLAEEGKDVPVYSVNKNSGLVEIKLGRNPRITGTEQKLVRITLDNGSQFDVTPNHLMLLRDGSSKEAKDLVRGDSLPRFKKSQQKASKDSQNYWQVHCNAQNSLKKRVFEHRLIAEFHEPEKWDQEQSKAKKQAWAKGGLVVHHKDYNGLNNSPDNLEIMTWKEHQKFHAAHDTIGEKNGRYLGKTSDELYQDALGFTKSLGRRFSHKEWQVYAKTNTLPQTFSKMHHDILGKSPTELAMLCAVELGYEHTDSDPRLVKTLQSMLTQGYDAQIVETQVIVKKDCETCSSEFGVAHDRREIAFCSHSCSLEYVNSNPKVAQKRIIGRNKQAFDAAQIKMENQAKIWSSLKFTLERKPFAKEWEQACKKESVPFRIGKALKYGFKSYREVCAAGENYNHKVLSVEELSGLHTVYNITVDDNHTVSLITSSSSNMQDGIIAYNCGEITLSPYDSCRLLLVNTLSFVKEPFTSSASFDFALFGKTVQDAQRLMDDIIDLEIENIDRILYKIEKDPEPEEVKAIELNLWKKIRKSCIEGRRTGLGVTAIGDTVAALNVVYGTEESVTVIENIYRELALNSYRSSVAMAASRGTFGVYDYELEKDHPFILRIMNLDPKLTTDWKKYGRRNIANTTTAPAGSVSICAQTTSGIEPAFQVSYTRRKKINPDDKSATVDFVDDLGDRWQHFDIFHHGFKKWMEVTNSTVEDYEQSPFFGAMANDINWLMKVKAQAAAQKWICHSISNTTNVPNDTTIDTIKDIYVAGWETGCKGITIYRDGCRAGVLVNPTTRSPSGAFADNEAPERPDFLPCDIYHMTVRGEKWNAFVGLMDNRPYEIFAGRAEYVSIPRSRKTGTINKNGKYNVQIGDGENEIVIKDLAHIFENTTESAFTRTISLALRHGTPVQYIVEQLSKGADKESEMFSLSKGLMRVLKNYISDGTEASQKKCSNCDAAGNLVYQEGCVTCHDCGFSKCG